MITLSDLKTEDSTYEIGLSRLIGKKIKEVRGYLSNEFNEPVFKLTKIEFEDGTFLGAEGEHDFPYLTKWGGEQPNYDNETLQRLYDEGAEDSDDD